MLSTCPGSTFSNLQELKGTRRRLNELTQALGHSKTTHVEESIASVVALLNDVKNDVVDTEKKADEVNFAASAYEL